jgi:hypothetical protein
MQTNRHSAAKHDDAERRWLHENDLVRPYWSLPLTTRTTGTAFARRVSPEEVAFVSTAGVRLVRWH